MDTPRKSIAAALAGSREVAGLTLPPMNALHFLALQAAESTFVTKGAAVTGRETLVALYILSRTPEELARVVNSPLDLDELALPLAANMRQPEMPQVTREVMAHILDGLAPLPPGGGGDGPLPQPQPGSEA